MASTERETEKEDFQLFDGGEDGHEEEGSNLPMVIVISLLVLAAFGGVVWVAYNNGVAHGHVDTKPVDVQVATSDAPAAPAAEKPVKAYQQPAGSDEAAAAKPAKAVTPAEPAPVPASKPPAQLMPQAAKTVAPPALPPPAAVAKPAPAPAAVAKPVAKAPAAPVTAAATGNYVLQVGAYKSEAEALAAWKTYQNRHAGLLSGAGPNIQKADLGEKGTWFRLRVGAFASKDAATALCDKLKAEGGACFPAK